MRVLLDTHIVLWWLEDHPRLSRKIRKLVSDGNNQVLVSAVTLWEIAIKQALGKLTLPDDFFSRFPDAGFQELPITWEHARVAGSFPPHHSDPFDRMLAAQARVEKLTLVSTDSIFENYPVFIFPG